MKEFVTSRMAPDQKHHWEILRDLKSTVRTEVIFVQKNYYYYYFQTARKVSAHSGCYCHKVIVNRIQPTCYEKPVHIIHQVQMAKRNNCDVSPSGRWLWWSLRLLCWFHSSINLDWCRGLRWQIWDHSFSHLPGQYFQLVVQSHTLVWHLSVALQGASALLMPPTGGTKLYSVISCKKLSVYWPQNFQGSSPSNMVTRHASEKSSPASLKWLRIQRTHGQ